MSKNQNNTPKAQNEEDVDQALVKLTLDEAEAEAQLIKKTAEAEASKITDEAKEEAKKIVSDGEDTVEQMIKDGENIRKALKGAKYRVVTNIKEDGEAMKKGTAYTGKDAKNIKRLLEIGAIKLNR